MMAIADDSDAYSVVASRANASIIETAMREFGRAESLALRALWLAEKYQFRVFIPLCKIALGLARLPAGHPSIAVSLVREGINGLLESGRRSRITPFTAALAAALAENGAFTEALETVEQVLKVNSGESMDLPEIFRIRGQLRAKRLQTKLAEADFNEAIALARSTEAKTLELRSTIGLAHLLQDTGRPTEAFTMLAAIYNWFTEGFDTADLKDARALLDELRE
jgi:tetratricopeptide (TPR) repeat protein